MSKTKKDYNQYVVGEDEKTHSGYKYDDKYTLRIAKNDITIQKALRKGYLFEKINIMLMYQYITTNSIILDVGANIGTVSIPLAKAVPDGKVYAFEPTSKTRKFLEQNISMNNANVTVVPKAVGHISILTSMSNTVTQFQEYKKGDGKCIKIKNKQLTIKKKSVSSADAIEHGGIQLGPGGERVEMTTIDIFTADFKQLDLIKIDVEGAESLVFWGAKNTIAKFKPVIIYEYNWQKLSDETLRELKVTQDIRRFDPFKYCRDLGYNKIIESDLEDYMIIHSDTERTINDPNIQFIPVRHIEALSAFDLRGYSLFRLKKPKW
jgi:FkbM family methyltransferase